MSGSGLWRAGPVRKPWRPSAVVPGQFSSLQRENGAMLQKVIHDRCNANGATALAVLRNRHENAHDTAARGLAEAPALRHPPYRYIDTALLTGPRERHGQLGGGGWSRFLVVPASGATIEAPGCQGLSPSVYMRGYCSLFCVVGGRLAYL